MHPEDQTPEDLKDVKVSSLKAEQEVGTSQMLSKKSLL